MSEQPPKLMEEATGVMRVRHYSIHTERAYKDWIKRYIKFHSMGSRDDLKDGERKVEGGDWGQSIVMLLHVQRTYKA